MFYGQADGQSGVNGEYNQGIQAELTQLAALEQGIARRSDTQTFGAAAVGAIPVMVMGIASLHPSYGAASFRRSQGMRGHGT